VADTSLVLQAHERSASSTLVAVVIRTGAALGTVLAFAWYRSRVDRLGSTARRILGWAGIAWAALFVVGFVWTHPRHRDDKLATSLEVAVVSYCLIIVVVAVCFLPVAVLRLSRPKTHDPGNEVRVWEVRDKEPYLCRVLRLRVGEHRL
jgi:cytochrome bd-type quinol oxidase subunit 2